MIQDVDLSKCFADYHSGKDTAAALQYIQQEFGKRMEDSKRYIVVCCFVVVFFCKHDLFILFFVFGLRIWSFFPRCASSSLRSPCFFSFFDSFRFFSAFTVSICLFPLAHFYSLHVKYIAARYKKDIKYSWDDLKAVLLAENKKDLEQGKRDRE